MPPEVLKYQSALESIPGATEVSITKEDLSELSEDDFSLLPYGDLPLGAMKRSNGGKKHELLISANFSITRDEKGLKALEFISWWVRDAARSGWPIQIRSLGMPPLESQFGKTLSFTVDYFYTDETEDMGNVLKQIDKLGTSLKESREIYSKVIDS